MSRPALPAAILCSLGLLGLAPATQAQTPPNFHDASLVAWADGSETHEAALLPAVAPAPAPVSKRLFGIIPNYRADQATEYYKPLTTAAKFRIARNDSFDWPNLPLLAGFALETMMTSGGFTHNGGFKGFGEFYARGYADQIVGSYLTEAILPSLLRADPRYFRLGTGTILHRVAYAGSRVFVTRMDKGGSGFNVSEVAGNAGVVALTTLYYPGSQSAGEAGERYAMKLGNDAISNLLTEFWPDIRRHLHFHVR